jgi:hypothetical protein
MSAEMELVVDAGGDVRCIYDETLDLREIGKLQITRASHVEPDRDGFWWADMGPSGGPVLGPYGSRTEALGAEREWLSTYRHRSESAAVEGGTPCTRVPRRTQGV